MIKRVLGWEPSTPLRAGMAKTYAWIAEQYALRKAGQKVVI
jgi:nucleoside-diphosphate-sugar epimerase